MSQQYWREKDVGDWEVFDFIDRATEYLDICIDEGKNYMTPLERELVVSSRIELNRVLALMNRRMEDE